VTRRLTPTEAFELWPLKLAHAHQLPGSLIPSTVSDGATVRAPHPEEMGTRPHSPVAGVLTTLLLLSPQESP
jgi:hypothetical protein